ncbi:MAG TPA: hypothetical protein VM013_01950, partial [Dehalococcoidia bacterium]|nr:hypothetical protein [Dehalococcoidia bacterium]
KEEGVWHEWDGVSDPQQLNLTFFSRVGGINTPNVGTGDSAKTAGDRWGMAAIALSIAGLTGIATAIALRKRRATTS